MDPRLRYPAVLCLFSIAWTAFYLAWFGLRIALNCRTRLYSADANSVLKEYLPMLQALFEKFADIAVVRTVMHPVCMLRCIFTLTDRAICTSGALYCLCPRRPSTSRCRCRLGWSCYILLRSSTRFVLCYIDDWFRRYITITYASVQRCCKRLIWRYERCDASHKRRHCDDFAEL